MAAAQALQAKIDILWYKIHQEEVYNTVETDAKKKIARLENIANLYTELAPLIQLQMQWPPVPPPPQN